MKKFRRKIGRGFASLLATVALATIVCFGLMFLVPGDAAQQIALARYGVASAGSAEVEEIRRRENLDKPVFVQFGVWFLRIARGDFGRSLVSGKSVADEIASRISVTLALASAAALFSILMAFPLSIWATIKPSVLRRILIFGVSIGGAAIPNFWLAYLLMLIFAVGFGVLPVAGYGTFSHLILPTVSLGIGGALLLQLLHKELQTAMTQDYIRTAKAVGVGEFRLVAKYALKNAVLPTIAVLSVFFVQLLNCSKARLSSKLFLRFRASGDC
ncbi:MAG TPA: ABC transporter permease [Pyrinomonadaceae bacterium]|nr:ABC transporter permease [Pyrinomonadaceae bacterium]